MASCQVEETVLSEEPRDGADVWPLLPPGGELKLLHVPVSLHERPACALCWQVIYIEADGSLRWCYGWSCQTIKRFFYSSLGEVGDFFYLLLLIFLQSCIGARGRDRVQMYHAAHLLSESHLLTWSLKVSLLPFICTDGGGLKLRRDQSVSGFTRSSSFITDVLCWQGTHTPPHILNPYTQMFSQVNQVLAYYS